MNAIRLAGMGSVPASGLACLYEVIALLRLASLTDTDNEMHFKFLTMHVRSTHRKPRQGAEDKIRDTDARSAITYCATVTQASTILCRTYLIGPCHNLS